MHHSLGKWAVAIAVSFTLASMSCFAVNSPYLITIDVSNPANVTLTATGINALANTTGQTAEDGVDLLGFFSQDAGSISINPLSAQELAGAGLSPYEYFTPDNRSSAGGGFFDLNLISASGDPENFSTSLPAFTGTSTFNLGYLDLPSSALPATGSQGDILAGDSENPGQVIGEWEVEPAPEPGILGIFALGTLIVVFFGQRHHSSSKSRWSIDRMM
jgi:hypothetical protein